MATGEYLYGTYGYLADSVSAATADNSTVALYIGTAPINLVRGYADKGLVNKPIRLKNAYQARNTIGYAADWDTYTLSEAVAAHFANSQGNQGPIYVINVLDPSVHKASTATALTLNFVNGSASFESEDIILDTLALADKAEGEDYIVSYNFDTHKVSIVSADQDNPIEGAVAATYYDVDASSITESDIIGNVSLNGEYTGMQAAALIYQTYGVIVNLFAAPKWSGLKSVYNALVGIATKLNGHWDGFVYADIPLAYSETVEVTSYTYDAVDSPNPGDNPSTEGWHELDSDTGVYSPSADTQVNKNKTYYTVVAEVGTPDSDPATEGFYEQSGTSPYTYTPTTDNTVDGGKTYYNVTATEATADPGDSPFDNGWYEESGDDYVPSTDAQVDVLKTYYTRTAHTSEETVTGTCDTIEKAIAYKTSRSLNSERSKVFWPKAAGTDGNIYNLSTLAIVETMRVDSSHTGVPMETCGNKPIPVNKQYFGAASQNAGYDVESANDLCEKGLATVVFWGGSWKLWGDHTAAYEFDNEEVDDRAIFDVSMRMLLYLTNRFQVTWANTVDKPFTVQLKDTILTREQEKLDALVVMGALIGKPTITFEEAYNTFDDVKHGNFRWDVSVTPTPPMKSASAYVAYTDAGLSAYFD